jgi:hypothetical protein
MNSIEYFTKHKLDYCCQLEFRCPKCTHTHPFRIFPGMSVDKIILICKNCDSRNMVYLSATEGVNCFDWENVEEEKE